MRRVLIGGSAYPSVGGIKKNAGSRAQVRQESKYLNSAYEKNENRCRLILQLES